MTMYVQNIRTIKEETVCAKYKNNKRGNDNFIESDCLPFDIDNDHAEDEKKWIKPSDVARRFPDVEFFVHYSRNNMKEKTIILDLKTSFISSFLMLMIML